MCKYAYCSSRTAYLLPWRLASFDRARESRLRPNLNDARRGGARNIDCSKLLSCSAVFASPRTEPAEPAIRGYGRCNAPALCAFWNPLTCWNVFFYSRVKSINFLRNFFIRKLIKLANMFYSETGILEKMSHFFKIGKRFFRKYAQSWVLDQLLRHDPNRHHDAVIAYKSRRNSFIQNIKTLFDFRSLQ